MKFLSLLSRTNSNPENSRTYFEVWADTLENGNFLKRMNISLIMICLILLVLLHHAQQKPPLVIRIDEVGRAEAISDTNTTNVVTKPEVLNFVRLFMRNFLERNFYTWKENFDEAGKMMTMEFRTKINSESDMDHEVLDIETRKLTSKLTFSNMEVTQETQENLLITLKGWRQMTSLNDSKYISEIIFEGELVLKKVPRTTETPYGLLVDSYKQTVYKNE